jgi:hypothetical protein
LLNFAEEYNVLFEVLGEGREQSCFLKDFSMQPKWRSSIGRYRKRGDLQLKDLAKSGCNARLFLNAYPHSFLVIAYVYFENFFE